MANFTLYLNDIINSNIELFNDNCGLLDEHFLRFKENFINFYMFYEIGFETIGQFKFKLNSKLKLVAPYYNKLYETVDLIKAENILNNYDLNESYTRETEGLNKFLDTPQGDISNLDNYLTNATDIKNIETFNNRRYGNIGVQTSSDILRIYRQELLNVDNVLIDELRDLFMMIF